MIQSREKLKIKYLVVVIQLKKLIIMQKLQILKINIKPAYFVNKNKPRYYNIYSC